MFCSGCGHALEAGTVICPQCGRPVAVPVPPIPGYQFELENYAGKVKALGVVWLIYAGISVLAGITGLIFVHAILSGNWGPWAHMPWMHGPWDRPWPHDAPAPFWMGRALLRFVWVSIVVRAGLALLAGWGLLQRTGWGRIVAIIAAILSLLKFPLGTALAIWTLILLLGYRNSTLYQQL